MSSIYDLKVYINQQQGSILEFDPKNHSYTIEVPRDCFALRIHVDYDPAYYIRITADHDAGRFQTEDLDPAMGDYLAGTEVPFYEYYDGYLLRLDKRRSALRCDLDMNISVEAGSYELGSESWQIRLIRRADTATMDLFTMDSFWDDEYNVRVPYALYVPTDYDPDKKYPVVIGLHGTGEMIEPLEAMLEKMELGTAWARDSEQGHNQCIVLIPQCIQHYDEEDNWVSLVQFIHGHSNSPFWPLPQLKAVWNLLNMLKSRYSIDDKRVYLTGMSSGGFACYVMAMDHPGAFAAIVPISCAANPERISELKGVPMWIFHSDDDPLIVPEWSLNPTLQNLSNAGVEYRLTRYPAKQVFWQSGHFAWEVCYHDKEMRDWLFAQKLS